MISYHVSYREGAKPDSGSLREWISKFITREEVRIRRDRLNALQAKKYPDRQRSKDWIAAEARRDKENRVLLGDEYD